ncbi:MAG: hypothetical protein ACRDTG_13180 [Pseudonocardiaceae bacterium]
MSEEIDPAMWARPDLRPVLLNQDIGALYRAVNESGVSQRRIAALTGTSQPQVADIITGRRARVMAYEVLVRNARGLSIPLERMGLSWWGPDGRWYGPEGAYCGEVTVTHTPPEGVNTAMLRRHLIAWGGTLLAGAPIAELGELLDDLGEPPPVELPDRLSAAHVTQVRDLIRRLGVGQTYCATDVLSAATQTVTPLLRVPGADPVRRALLVAVAELHIAAGWAAYDAGRYRRALYHFARSLELGAEAQDAYLQALALGYAGMLTVEHGHPDDGLKMLQCAQVRAWAIPDDDQRAVVVGEVGAAAVEASTLVNSATALARLGHLDAAVTQLAKGRDLWTPAPTDPFGDMDRPAALLELQRGRLDVAEALAMASTRRWQNGRLTSRTRSRIVLATIHVTAGEQRGLQLAHTAITDTAKLTSVRIRRQLLPLADTLETRPGSDYRELARMARQVAA